MLEGYSKDAGGMLERCLKDAGRVHVRGVRWDGAGKRTGRRCSCDAGVSVRTTGILK